MGSLAARIERLHLPPHCPFLLADVTKLSGLVFPIETETLKVSSSKIQSCRQAVNIFGRNIQNHSDAHALN